MPISGVRLGGGPEYQLPSQETLVLAKAAVMALVSSPLTMIPRFGAFEPLVAGEVAGDAASPAGVEEVAGVTEALRVDELLVVEATTGAVATVLGLSATAGVDVLELGSAPIPAIVTVPATDGVTG